MCRIIFLIISLLSYIVKHSKISYITILLHKLHDEVGKL